MKFQIKEGGNSFSGIVVLKLKPIPTITHPYQPANRTQPHMKKEANETYLKGNAQRKKGEQGATTSWEGCRGKEVAREKEELLQKGEESLREGGVS